MRDHRFCSPSRYLAGKLPLAKRRRRVRLVTLLLLLSAGFAQCGFVRSGLAQERPDEPAAKPARPHVILIVLEDLGPAALGCCGNPHISTPALDEIAQRGTRFTQFYAAAPRSSPARAAILTGCYPARFRIFADLTEDSTTRPSGLAQELDPQAPSMARQFHSAGYRTAYFGTWDLSSASVRNRRRPLTDYGFDESFVLDLPQASQESATTERSADDQAGGADNAANAERAGDSTAPPDDLRTQPNEACVERAIQFVRRMSETDQPFFLCLSPARVPPRKPWTEKQPASTSETQVDISERALPSRGRPVQQRYEATLEAIDLQLAMLLETLGELELERQTLLVVTGDNGPPALVSEAAPGVFEAWDVTGGLRGRRGSLYEGGVRLPLLVCWPDQIPAGRVNEEDLLGAIDLFPTLCRLAQVDPSEIPLDGEDRAEVWRGTAQPRKAPLFFEYARDATFPLPPGPLDQSPNLAVRDERWKLLMNADDSRLELYDVADRVDEFHNVAGDHPEVVTRLQRSLIRWYRGFPGTRVASSPTTPTRLILQTRQGHSIPAEQVPDVSGAELDVHLRFEAVGEDGVLLAQGDSSSGYAVHLRDRHVVFAVRQAGRLQEVVADEPLVAGRFYDLHAKLDRERAMILRINGRLAATPRLTALFYQPPGESLDIGFDRGEPVGSYGEENRFAGRLQYAGLMLYPLAQTPRPTRLVTALAGRSRPSQPLPGQPQPLAERDRFMNLNGPWEYAIAAADKPPTQWSGAAIVPYPAESLLSRVQRQVDEGEAYWLRRTIRVPADWSSSAVRLHVGSSSQLIYAAVDGEALPVAAEEAWRPQAWMLPLDKQGPHEKELTFAFAPWGGRSREYLWAPYRFEVELDPLRVTGPLETIWLEPIPARQLTQVEAIPDFEGRTLQVRVVVDASESSADEALRLRVFEGERIVAEQQRRIPAETEQRRELEFVVPIEDPRLWRLEQPQRYTVDVERWQGERRYDHRRTFAAFREFRVAQDAEGNQRFWLNRQPLFLVATPYAAWWPEGLASPPTSAAVLADITRLKSWGFNSLIVPPRHLTSRLLDVADRAGMLLIPGRLPEAQDAEDEHSGNLGKPRWSLRRDELLRGGRYASLVAWLPDVRESPEKLQTSERQAVDAAPLSLTHRVQIFNWPAQANPQQLAELELLPHRQQLAVLTRVRTRQVGVPGHVVNPYQSIPENWQPRNAEASRTLLQALEGMAELKQAGLAGCVIDSVIDLHLRTDGLLSYDRQHLKLDPEQLRQALEALSE